jgi:hypothetical protein
MAGRGCPGWRPSLLLAQDSNSFWSAGWMARSSARCCCSSTTRAAGAWSWAMRLGAGTGTRASCARQSRQHVPTHLRPWASAALKRRSIRQTRCPAHCCRRLGSCSKVRIASGGLAKARPMTPTSTACWPKTGLTVAEVTKRSRLLPGKPAPALPGSVKPCLSLLRTVVRESR